MSVSEQHEPPLERVLPQDLSLERAVLGAILLHPQHWSQVASILTADDFFRAAHGLIFSAMARLNQAESAIDFALLRTELRSSGDEDEIGGPVYLASLVDGLPLGSYVMDYARVVREKARLRTAIAVANKLTTEAYAAERSVVEIVDAGVRDLLTLADAQESGVTSIRDALKSYMDALDDEQAVLIPTGLRDVDDIVGGFGRKKLTIIASRPGVGKSSLAVTAADHAAGAGTPTAIISLEMVPSALAGNLLASHSGVGTERMRRKVVGEWQWTRVTQAVELLMDRPLYFVTAVKSLTQVAAWVCRLKEQYGVRLVFLDYLQLLGDPRAKDRQQEVAALSRGLKWIAIDEDIALVALSQLSREPERRNDKRPHLSDLRESGSIEADADLVLLLFREEMHKPMDENRGIAEVIIAKNRQGPTGSVRVAFIAETVRFADLALC